MAEVRPQAVVGAEVDPGAVAGPRVAGGVPVAAAHQAAEEAQRLLGDEVVLCWRKGLPWTQMSLPWPTRS